MVAAGCDVIACPAIATVLINSPARMAIGNRDALVICHLHVCAKHADAIGMANGQPGIPVCVGIVDGAP